jgi:hypothetical protein
MTDSTRAYPFAAGRLSFTNTSTMRLKEVEQKQDYSAKESKKSCLHQEHKQTETETSYRSKRNKSPLISPHNTKEDGHDDDDDEGSSWSMPEDLLLISEAAAQMMPLLSKYTRNNSLHDGRDPSNIWKQQQQQQTNSVVDYVKRKDSASTYKTILMKTHDHSPNRPYTHDQPMLQA